MSRFYLHFLLFLFYFFSINSTGQEKLKLLREEIDFGMIAVDTVRTKGSYYMRTTTGSTKVEKIGVVNLSDEPMIFTFGRWPCDWCPSHYPKEPFMPGDTAYIELNCTATYARKFSKPLRIETNIGDVFGRVLGHFQIVPHTLEIDDPHLSVGNGQVRPFRPREDTILVTTITNVSKDETLFIHDFETESPFSIDQNDFNLQPGESKELQVKVIAYLQADDDCEFYYPDIYFVSSGKFDELVKINGTVFVDARKSEK